MLNKTFNGPVKVKKRPSSLIRKRFTFLWDIRELKIETFSGRRPPDWQSKPGTEVAVASLQNSNIKIAVNSGGRRL